MPKRPRSHQLETLSEGRFRSLIPEAWVVRRKDFDYGIDLEVELFDQHEASTGLMFYVQLKATDDDAKRKHISLKEDSKAYYRSLIIPTMLVRYCAADTSTHWKWNFDIPDVAEGKQSQAVEFTDADFWNDNTPARIEEALRLWRRLRNQKPNQTVPLYLDVGSLNPEQRQPSRTLVRKLVNESGALSWQDDLTQDTVLGPVDKLIGPEAGSGDMYEAKIAC